MGSRAVPTGRERLPLLRLFCPRDHIEGVFVQSHLPIRWPNAWHARFRDKGAGFGLSLQQAGTPVWDETNSQLGIFYVPLMATFFRM